MGARARILRYKLRFVVIGLVLLAVGSVVLFCLLNLSFGNKSGAFERTSMKYELAPEVAADALERLDIDATDVRLELGMASNIRHLQIGMYGKDYKKQKVTVHIKGGRVSVAYPKNSAKAPKDLTLRIMIPQGSLRQVQIVGEQLPMHIERLRTDRLLIRNGEGDILMKEVNANRVEAAATEGDLRLEKNIISQLTLQSGYGTTTLRNNKTRLCVVAGEQGDVRLFAPNWQGQTIVQTNGGNITAVSRHTPWSLMIDAQTGGGSVHIDYDKARWKHPDIIEKGRDHWTGSVGNNPANALTLESGDGNITVAKRGRYTDTFSTDKDGQ